MGCSRIVTFLLSIVVVVLFYLWWLSAHGVPVHFHFL